jgi:hypothetical protein
MSPTLPPPYTRPTPRSTSCCPSCTAATWYDAFLPGLLPQKTHTRLNRDGSGDTLLLLLLLPGLGILTAAVLVVEASSRSIDISRSISSSWYR